MNLIIGAPITVIRTSGDIESDWEICDTTDLLNPYMAPEIQRVGVTQPHTNLVKYPRVNTLLSWNVSEAA